MRYTDFPPPGRRGPRNCHVHGASDNCRPHITVTNKLFRNYLGDGRRSIHISSGGNQRSARTNVGSPWRRRLAQKRLFFVKVLKCKALS